MKLSDLGFKYFSQEFDWALPKGNVRVEQSPTYKGFWTLKLDKNFKRSKYDHLLYVTRIPKASLMKFLENNIESLKEFDKSPNKTFVNKIKSEVRSLSKPLRFKNMWMDYNFKMPSNAKKGILYEISSLGNKGFAKKVESVIVPILSKTIFSKAITDDYMCGNSDQTFFETKKKDRKVALSIPYIKQVNKRAQKEAEDDGEDPNDYGYEGAVLMSNYYRGKVKGIGEDATLYYFVLLMGCDMEDDIADPSVCVEVITPLDKGEDFFLNEVKNAVAKFNPLKFTGKAIKVNKCPKAVTGSAEMKPYSYKGQVITASSKEEAIAQIVKSGAIGDFFKRLLHQETYLGQHLEKNKNKYDICTRNIASLIMRFIDYDKARSDLNNKNFVISFLDTANKAAGIIQDVAEKTSSKDEKALLNFEYVVSKQLHRVYDWVDNNTNKAMDSNLTSSDCKNFANNALKEYGKK